MRALSLSVTPLRRRILMKTKMVGTVLLSGLIFAGCGGSATTTNAPATNAKPATPPAAPTAPTTPTSVSVPGGGTATTGSIPADFPKDVPVYAGAGITSASTAGGMAVAVLTTADAPEKVAAYYKDELEKQGWS